MYYIYPLSHFQKSNKEITYPFLPLLSLKGLLLHVEFLKILVHLCTKLHVSMLNRLHIQNQASDEKLFG